MGGSAKTCITASTRFRFACPRCANARWTFRCWPSDFSRAIARRTGCRSTQRCSRAKPSICCRPITGRATSASSRARCRAPRCRRRAAAFGRPTSNFFTRPNRPPKTTASVCRRCAKPNGHTSSVSSTPARGTKKEAARILEISRGTLYRKILEFGLEPQAHSSQSRNRARRLTAT